MWKGGCVNFCLTCFIVAIYIRLRHPARELLKVASFEVQKVTHANVHSLPRCQPNPLPSAPVSRRSSQGCIRAI